MPAIPQCASTHPYFSLAEASWFLAMPVAIVLAVVSGVIGLVGGVIWFRTRSRVGPMILTLGALLLVAAFGGFGLVPDAGAAFRSQFGADDLARLQRELQTREADLERYGREHPGLPNSQIVKGYLATHPPGDGFHFSDPAVPPLYFKVSDWRDKVPRVVISIGCNNNIVFDSRTMDIEQLD